jgi:hypothetical protein
MIITSVLKKIVIVVVTLLLLSTSCVLFVQFYPFPKSQMLSKLKYPVVTQTASGEPGDPINVVIIGDQSAIQNAFLKAGWRIPDPITAKSSARIALDSLANRPYPDAPVSNLYLYHRKQDLVFEKPTNTVRNRDHIRLWNTHTTIGSEKVWCGSATYDNGIEISSNTEMPTHHIAPNVDRERDMILHTLKPYMAISSLVQFTQPNLYGTNGGGDWYSTDGEIAILSTGSVAPVDLIQQRSAAVTVKNWLFHILTSCT